MQKQFGSNLQLFTTLTISLSNLFVCLNTHIDRGKQRNTGSKYQSHVNLLREDRKVGDRILCLAGSCNWIWRYASCPSFHRVTVVSLSMFGFDFWNFPFRSLYLLEWEHFSFSFVYLLSLSLLFRRRESELIRFVFLFFQLQSCKSWGASVVILCLPLTIGLFSLSVCLFRKETLSLTQSLVKSLLSLHDVSPSSSSTRRWLFMTVASTPNPEFPSCFLVTFPDRRGNSQMTIIIERDDTDVKMTKTLYDFLFS